MNHDLIERYIYAATRQLPKKSREDVANELRCLIDDMLAERCGNLPPTEKDIRVVLTELGSPQELYEKYSEDGKKCLIGQPYYSTYLLVLKIVLICAGGGLLLSNLILQIMEPQPWYAMAGQLLAMLLQGLMGAFAFVTLLFAFFYHKGVRISEPFNFDDLPPVPKKNQEIPLGDPIAGIVFSLVFLGLFLGFPQIFSVHLEAAGWIPIFHIDVLRNSWPILLLFTACGIGREVVCLTERRYNRRVLIATLTANGISALLAIWWLTGTSLISKEFLENISAIFAGDREIVQTMFANFQYFFLAVMLFALLLDTCTCAWKSLRQ